MATVHAGPSDGVRARDVLTAEYFGKIWIAASFCATGTCNVSETKLIFLVLVLLVIDSELGELDRSTE